MFGKVLCIQSHTVFGYVGNKAAVFPLQLLGFDVSFINSVQFSNHTGYENGFQGQVLSGQELKNLRAGLEANNLLEKFEFLITGYIGSESFLREVIDFVKELRIKQPNLQYFCDPVLGDHGKLYVPEALIEIYRSEVLPLVSVLTPNHFELEKLTDMTISSVDDIKAGCRLLHLKGISLVVLTSTHISPPSATDGAPRQQLIASLCSEEKKRLFFVSFPYLDSYFTGSGDLTTALLLAWVTREGLGNLELALRKCVCTLQEVLKKTIRSKLAGKNAENELKLVDSRFDILEPSIESSEVSVETYYY